MSSTFEVCRSQSDAVSIFCSSRMEENCHSSYDSVKDMLCYRIPCGGGEGGLVYGVQHVMATNRGMTVTKTSADGDLRLWSVRLPARDEPRVYRGSIERHSLSILFDSVTVVKIHAHPNSPCPACARSCNERISPLVSTSPVPKVLRNSDLPS